MSAVETALTRVNAVLQEFAHLLEDEAQALASQDADKMAALLPKRLEIHERLRDAWQTLGELAGDASSKGLADLRQRLFVHTPPPPTWHELERRVQATNRLNRINGRLIQEQMQRIQAALQVLQQSLSSRSVYDAEGHMSDLFDVNRRIDSA